MKNHNFSLRAFALAVATLFATTGCGDDSTSDETGGGNPDPAPTTATIKIAVSDIQGTSATVAATPSSNDLTYMVDIAAKEDFEEYASAEAYAAAVVDEIKAEAEADGTALNVYLVAEGLLSTGAQRDDFSGLETSTDYVAYAFGLSSEGEITTKVFTAEFTTLDSDPEPEQGPDADVLLRAGKLDDTGENFLNTSSSVTVGVILNNETDVVTSVYEFFATTAAIENVLATYDMTHEELLDIAIQGEWEQVYAYQANEIAFLNEHRIVFGSYNYQDPETSYTAIIKVTGSNGISTVVYDSAETTDAGEPTDAYKAWLGTWTVTSTSATYSQEAKTFDITISERYANHSYSIGGLTSSVYRDMEGAEVLWPTALYDAETGAFSIANQLYYGDEDEEGYYEFWYNLRYTSTANSKTYVNNVDGLTGLIGELDANSTESGQITGTTLQNSSGATAGTVLWMDYFYWYYDDSGNTSAIYGCNPAEMFTYNEKYIDYPIGPFTLTKKTETTEPTPEPETPEVTKLRVKSLGKQISAQKQEKLGPVYKMTEETRKPSKTFDYRLTDKQQLVARMK